MDKDMVLFMRQLEDIMDSNLSDNFLKRAAQNRLEELQCDLESTSLPTKRLAAVK